MSGGWISGILYPVLIFTTAIHGARKRAAADAVGNGTYIAVFFDAVRPPFSKSFIIDTDHWRHYYLLLGVTWGIAVASGRWRNDDVRGGRPAGR